MTRVCDHIGRGRLSIFRLAVCLFVAPSVGILSQPGEARAEWWIQSPDDLCVARQVLVDAVSESVAPEALTGGSRRTARVSIEPAAGLLVIMVAEEGLVLGERRLEVPGASCAVLADAAAFVLATLIEGGALEEATGALPEGEGATQLAPPGSWTPSSVPDEEERGEEPEPAEGMEPVPEERRLSEVREAATAREESDEDAGSDRETEQTPSSVLSASQGNDVWSVTTGVALRTGTNPGIGLGPTLSIGWTRGWWAVCLHGAFFRGTHDFAGRRLEVSAGEVGLRGCMGTVGAFRVEACVAADLGIHGGRGEGFDAPQRSRLLSLSAGGGVGLRYARGRFLVRVGVGGRAFLRRARFVFQRDGDVLPAYRQRAGAFTADAAFGVRWGLGPE